MKENDLAEIEVTRDYGEDDALSELLDARIAVAAEEILPDVVADVVAPS